MRLERGILALQVCCLCVALLNAVFVAFGLYEGSSMVWAAVPITALSLAFTLWLQWED